MSHRVISFHYTLRDSAGKMLESSVDDEPMAYIEGVGNIIPGLEAALQGMKTGDKKTVNVPAKDAYGEYDKDLVVKVPRSELPKKEIKVGDQFHAESEGHSRVVVVTEVHADHVMIDGNHPLSGQDLNFEVEITGVRDATADELAHGHVHGPGGHHH